MQRPVRNHNKLDLSHTTLFIVLCYSYTVIYRIENREEIDVLSNHTPRYSTLNIHVFYCVAMFICIGSLSRTSR